MADRKRLVQVERAEIVCTPESFNAVGVVEKPLSTAERLANNTLLRRVVLLVALALLWQGYATYLDNDLLFPTFTATMEALYVGIKTGGLLAKAWTSISVLLVGYALGIALATLLTVFAITTRVGNDILETLTSMFNPLPAIALLPLALIWAPNRAPAANGPMAPSAFTGRAGLTSG